MSPRLGLALGDADEIASELAAGIVASATEIGLSVGWVSGPAEAADRDVVIGIGYPSWYPWLSETLPDTRRVAWLGEPLPPADDPIPARVRRALPMGRIIDAVATPARLTRGSPPASLVAARERAAFDHDRRHNLRAHRRAARSGVCLIVTSLDQEMSLRRAGISSRVVPFGYHPAHAGPVQPVDDANRDIDVLVLATDATGVPTRRARVLAEVLGELGSSHRVEVVERGAWGADRERLIGRARVVLNVHRAPGNFTGLRTLVVGAAGALLVSEPVETPAPFVPGIHYIEAPAGTLAAATREALHDRARRLDMAAALQRFLVEELTMARSLCTVLDMTAERMAV